MGRGLVAGEPIEQAQHEWGAELIREAVDLLVEHPPQVTPGDAAERVRGVGRVGRERGRRPSSGQRPAGHPDGDAV